MAQDRLSGLDHKQTSGDIQPYSRFIRSLQYILPLTALAILGVLILWPQLSKIQTEPLNEQDLQALKRAETQNTLSKPVFNTTDNKGNQVQISADNARQNRDDKNTILLEKPTATMRDNDNTLQLEATEGTYDQNQKILRLGNGVTLKDSQNSTLETNSLIADIEQNRATSETPAKLTTDQGTIEGQAVVIDQQNQTTIFKGPAKAVINPKE